MNDRINHMRLITCIHRQKPYLGIVKGETAIIPAFSASTPPESLQPCDVAECEVEKIGYIRNRIVAA
jgi:2-keto-4-pentenoate hydratase/2-oxohepta-3-ene-1,7-dioic acid hydratase in catechol pathway